MIYLHPKALDMLKGMQVKQDVYVHDTHMVRRSLRERLFSLPWRPLTRYKAVYCPTAYILSDGTVVVSPKTYRALIREVSQE